MHVSSWLETYSFLYQHFFAQRTNEHVQKWFVDINQMVNRCQMIENEMICIGSHSKAAEGSSNSRFRRSNGFSTLLFDHWEVAEGVASSS